MNNKPELPLTEAHRKIAVRSALLGNISALLSAIAVLLVVISTLAAVAAIVGLAIIAGT